MKKYSIYQIIILFLFINIKKLLYRYTLPDDQGWPSDTEEWLVAALECGANPFCKCIFCQ